MKIAEAKKMPTAISLGKRWAIFFAAAGGPAWMRMK
jgi:hypothetical protein